MATENLKMSTLGVNGRDANKEHAEATKLAQAAWDRAVAANEKNDREADERWEKAQKKEEGKQKGYVFAKSCALPDGVTDHSGFVPVESLKQYGSYAVLGTGGGGICGRHRVGVDWRFWQRDGAGEALGGQLVDAGPTECENHDWHGAAKHDLTRQRVLFIGAICRTDPRQHPR